MIGSFTLHYDWRVRGAPPFIKLKRIYYILLK